MAETNTKTSQVQEKERTDPLVAAIAKGGCEGEKGKQ